MTDNENVFLTKERKRYLLLIVGLIFLNIISFTLFNKRQGYDSGNYISTAPFENFKYGAITFLLVIPILSLCLATLIALFPNKNLNYGQRLKRVFLFVWLILNILMTFMHIVLSFEAYKTPEPECNCMPKTIQDSIAAVEAQAMAIENAKTDYDKYLDSLKRLTFDTASINGKCQKIIAELKIDNSITPGGVDTLIDLNYDKKPDILIEYYGTAGSGMKNYIYAYLYDSQKDIFVLDTSLSDLVNPTFYFQRKIVTSYYIANGGGEAWKYSWDGKFLKPLEHYRININDTQNRLEVKYHITIL